MKLFLKVVLFTVVVPGTFAGLLPVLIVDDRAVAGGAMVALASGLFAFGLVLYLRSAWDFAVFGSGTPAPMDAPKRLVSSPTACMRNCNPHYTESVSSYSCAMSEGLADYGGDIGSPDDRFGWETWSKVKRDDGSPAEIEGNVAAAMTVIRTCRTPNSQMNSGSAASRPL